MFIKISLFSYHCTTSLLSFSSTLRVKQELFTRLFILQTLLEVIDDRPPRERESSASIERFGWEKKSERRRLLTSRCRKVNLLITAGSNKWRSQRINQRECIINFDDRVANKWNRFGMKIMDISRLKCDEKCDMGKYVRSYVWKLEM